MSSATDVVTPTGFLARTLYSPSSAWEMSFTYKKLSQPFVSNFTLSLCSSNWSSLYHSMSGVGSPWTWQWNFTCGVPSDASMGLIF